MADLPPICEEEHCAQCLMTEKLRDAVKGKELNITLTKQPPQGPSKCHECMNVEDWRQYADEAIPCICTIEREMVKLRSRQQRRSLFSSLKTSCGVDVEQRQINDKNKVEGTINKMNDKRVQVGRNIVEVDEDQDYGFPLQPQPVPPIEQLLDIPPSCEVEHCAQCLMTQKLKNEIQNRNLNITLAKKTPVLPRCSECEDFELQFAGPGIPCKCTVEKEIKKLRSRPERYGRFNELMTSYGFDMRKRRDDDKKKIAGTIKKMNAKRVQVGRNIVEVHEDQDFGVPLLPPVDPIEQMMNDQPQPGPPIADMMDNLALNP